MFDWPLTPPKQVTLLLSLILAISACLVHWLHIAVPPLGSGFVLLVLGYVVFFRETCFATSSGPPFSRREVSAMPLLCRRA